MTAPLRTLRTTKHINTHTHIYIYIHMVTSPNYKLAPRISGTLKKDHYLDLTIQFLKRP